MRKLTMPENIMLEKIYLPGITKRELFPLLIAVIPGAVIAIALWIVLQKPLYQLFVLVGTIIYVALCYMIFARIDGSQSIYTFITRIIRYNKSQHYYFYKHGKEVAHYVGEKTE